MISKPPAPAPAPAVETSAIITGIEGNGQFRTADDQPWQKATLNTKLPLTASVRVGPRSAIRVCTDGDRVITIDRLGTASLRSALGRADSKAAGLDYGRKRYDLEADGIEHQSELVTPGSVLAIRGCPVGVIRFDARRPGEKDDHGNR